jgi:hypothetical protein
MYQILTEECDGPETCVVPHLTRKSVANGWVDFDVVRDLAALEFYLEIVRFGNRDGRVGFTVQDEHRAEAAHEKLHFSG